MSARDDAKRAKKKERDRFTDAVRELAELGWSLSGAMAVRESYPTGVRPKRRRAFEAGELLSPKERGRMEREREAARLWREDEHERFEERQRRRGEGPVEDGTLGFLGCRNWTITGDQCESDGCCSFEACRAENDRLRGLIDPRPAA